MRPLDCCFLPALGSGSGRLGFRPSTLGPEALLGEASTLFTEP